MAGQGDQGEGRVEDLRRRRRIRPPAARGPLGIGDQVERLAAACPPFRRVVAAEQLNGGVRHRADRPIAEPGVGGGDLVGVAPGIGGGQDLAGRPGRQRPAVGRRRAEYVGAVEVPAAVRVLVVRQQERRRLQRRPVDQPGIDARPQRRGELDPGEPPVAEATLAAVAIPARRVGEPGRRVRPGGFRDRSATLDRREQGPDAVAVVVARGAAVLGPPGRDLGGEVGDRPGFGCLAGRQADRHRGDTEQHQGAGHGSSSGSRYPCRRETNS